MFGSENQRAAMRGSVSGVHRLTSAMNSSTASSSFLACARARMATTPSTFIASQQAPSSPYPAIIASPQIRPNGVAQSSGPPLKAPLVTGMPWINPPRMTPCAKAASAEPPAKAILSQVLLRDTVRNSNATPRNTSASSITITGR